MFLTIRGNQDGRLYSLYIYMVGVIHESPLHLVLYSYFRRSHRTTQNYKAVSSDSREESDKPSGVAGMGRFERHQAKRVLAIKILE